MAKSESETGTVVATWVTPVLAREIRELADRDHRSVSSLIRLCLQDRIEDFAPAAKAERPPGESSHGLARSGSGAGSEES